MVDVIINHDCNTSRGLIPYGLFTSCKFKLILFLIFGYATSNFICFSFSTLASVSIRNRESIIIARVAQWWEHSPPTNVDQVQIPASTPYVGWACCWFFPLLQEGFLRVLRFPRLFIKNKLTFPNSNSIWNARTRYAPWGNKWKIYLQLQWTILATQMLSLMAIVLPRSFPFGAPVMLQRQYL